MEYTSMKDFNAEKSDFRSARTLGPSQGSGALCDGVVRAFLTEREASVETGTGDSVHARQAASCLLSPVIGDHVLLYVQGDDAHILAVLERSGQHAAEISVPGAERVALRAAANLDISAPAVALNAQDISLAARRAIMVTGESLTHNVRRLMEHVRDKIVGARTITTTVEMRTATVKDVETVKAGTLVQDIDHVATQKSDISLVTARKDVRLDAERVSVG